MLVGITSIFFASLAGIVALFTLKLWEERRMRVFFPNFRKEFDTVALKCKHVLVMAEETLVRLPSITGYLALRSLALLAVAFAKLARSASEGAHHLADFVSHKHNFERKETRSQFLKQVIEHKNLNGGANGSKKKPRKNVETQA